jgi:ribonuclease R
LRELAPRLVAALDGAGRRLLSTDELLRRAHFTPHERPLATRALRQLLRRGTVVEAKRDRFALSARQHLRAGRLSVHPDGFGFLIAEKDDLTAPPRGTETTVEVEGGARDRSEPEQRRAKGRRGAREPRDGRGRGRRGRGETAAPRARPDRQDLYVRGSGIRPAMHGDRVLASVLRRGRDSGERLEGQVVQILERRTARIVGVVRRGRTGTYVLPQDPRVPYRVRLAEPAPADAPPFNDGDLVVAEITRYPDEHGDIEARLTVVLGPASDPRVETESIIYKHDLPRDFPEAVRREAARVPREVPHGEASSEDLAAILPPPPSRPRPWRDTPVIAERLDLRGIPLVTIDGENARDFDDAVALIDAPGGGIRLVVAIADVAAYVARGSALDLEARARGTSVYFPDRVIPMLPEELSNGICSLNPDVDRLVQAVALDFNSRGETLGAAIFPGVMRSRARLTYTEVRQIVEDGDLTVRRRHAPLVDDLERMAEIADLLAGMRRHRGSIDFDLPEAEIVLDLRGRPENIVKAERNVAHRLIESFMLAANEAVAQYLTARRIPMPYRIHEPPEPEALDELARFLAGFGVRLPRTDDVTPVAFQHALARVVGRPEERLVNTVLLRTMKQARYSPVNAGHFGLAAPTYTHFTSPIRRYPDLVLHRTLAAALRHDTRELGAIAAELPAICEESSQRERVAMDAEREVVQLKKVQFMQDKVGETFTGFVSGVVPFGFFVELERYFIDGLVHVATLMDDRYELIEERHMLQGRRGRRTFRLGDPVTVRVASVSVERKQIDLVLVESADQPSTRRE